MQQTTNYKLNKIELADSPADITVLNVNWDKIDTELKKLTDEKFNKTGGEVSGKVTITKNGLKVTGGSETDTINVTENGEVGGTLTVSGKVTANGGLDVVGGIVNDGEYKLKVDITKGQTPSEAKFATIGIYDNSLSEGYRLGRIQYGISTNNTASMAMYVNRPNDAESENSCGLLAQWLNGTTARISVTHHPETASNDKSVATTYWVRNLKATASQYGLVKLADETAILNESSESALTVDKAYELNDFRHKETAYSVGDKVNCAFNFGLFLECTTAGTTSADALDTRNVTHGQVITDGTVQWTVRTPVKSVNGNVPDANGNITVPTTDANTIKQVVLDTFFPVGSIYMDATGQINPNSQFGGTWVKIENRFLLGSGTKSVGATGGEENVTLNVNQIPSHQHGVGDINAMGYFGNGTNDQFGIFYEATGVFSLSNGGKKWMGNQGNNDRWATANFNFINNRWGSTDWTGGTNSHNNMPPYEVVSIWKRTS